MHLNVIRRLRTLMLFAFVFVVSAFAAAQGTSGSLTGLVSDPTGAAVAGATVTLVNLGTNFQQTETTNGIGVYLISPVEPGNYSLKIVAAGFAEYRQTGIVINANEAATQDVKLKVGAVGQTVSVTADAELINTTTPELGMTVNESSVSQLPLNGRDPSTLVWLAPGVINANMGNSYTQSGFSFPNETDAAASGGRQGSTYYMLDGAPNMDTYLGRAAPFPNADATQEFTVITNNFNAIYGFAPGAVVSIQVKSGTNNIHGGVFEFLRDNDFDARDWFTHQINPLHQNQFGAYAGGPILKNKLFIFGNYQGTRSAAASSENQTYAPTAAMLSGDFSGYSSQLCKGGESAICPFTTIGGKPNQLDTGSGYSYNATALQIVKDALPQVGKPGVSTTGCTATEIAAGCVEYTSAAIINNYDEGTGRIDWDASSKQRVSLISFVNNLVQPSGDTPGNVLSMLPLSSWQYTFAEKMQYFNETLNHTWTMSPTMVNVASVFWTQMAAHNGSAALTADNKPFCWSSYINITELPGTCYLEGFEVDSGGFESGWYEPSQEERTTYGLYDSFSKTIGHHTIQAGVNIQHQFAEEFTQYPTEPELDWNGSYTGSGLADYLVGDLYKFTQGAGEVAPVSGWQPGFYGQDLYRFRSNINFTLGLRWDPNVPPQVTAGRAAVWVPGQQSTVYPNAPVGMVFPGDAGIGAGLMDTTYGYWEPRLGIAWQPKGLPKTSIHAGFGLFTQPMIYSTYNHTVDNAPFAPTFTPQGSTSAPLNFSSPWSTFTGTGGTSPFPPFASATYKPASNVAFASGLSIPATISPNFKLGVTQAWNVSVEQGFKSNMVARIAYVGTETYHQSTIIDQNPGVYYGASSGNNGSRELAPTFAGNILDMFSPGTASYNSLQMTGEWKESHGLQFQSNLTWSKAIDDTSSSDISFGYNAIGDPSNLAWSRGISSQNFPLVWVSNFVYTTSLLKGRNLLMREALGGWEVSGIYNWFSGAGLTINGGANGNNNSYSDQGEDRGDFVSGQPLNVKHGSRSQWLNEYFNTNAFTPNAPGTFGDTGKGIMRAPHTTYGDAGIDKNWQIAERYGLQFRWEFFNVFNHPSFGSPGTTLTWGNFGQISGTGSEPPRVMQGALKLTF
ncbi:MAG TPA: carboxypeptidase-like regulatory domain-containing protein [Terracidiphilus sp.]|nr:carboxypeptidase-like regulatory domain-containing protein [Terracidiphilus sp.]